MKDETISLWGKLWQSWCLYWLLLIYWLSRLVWQGETMNKIMMKDGRNLITVKKTMTKLSPLCMLTYSVCLDKILGYHINPNPDQCDPNLNHFSYLYQVKKNTVQKKHQIYPKTMLVFIKLFWVLVHYSIKFCYCTEINIIFNLHISIAEKPPRRNLYFAWH